MNKMDYSVAMLQKITFIAVLLSISLFAGQKDWGFNQDTLENYVYDEAFLTADSNSIILNPYSNPPWYDNAWPRRIRFSLSNASDTDMVDYPMLVEIQLSNGFKTDFSDLRIADNSGTNIISHYVEPWTFSENKQKLWIKIENLSAQTGIELFFYYGNSEADSTANLNDVFTSDTEIERYIQLGSIATTFDVFSFLENNTVLSSSIFSNTLSSIGFAFSQKPSSLSPLAARPDDENGSESLLPLSWQGTNFGMYGFRNSGDRFNLYSPHGDADITIFDDNSSYSNFTLNENSSLQFNFNFGSGDNARIVSDIPILAQYEGNGDTSDGMLMAPSGTNFYGTPSGSAYVIAFQDNTAIQIFDSLGNSSTVNLDAGEEHRITGTSQGAGDAYRVLSDKPIVVNNQADSDGSESVTWLNEDLLGLDYIIPNNAQYITVVAPHSNTTLQLFSASGVALGSAQFTGSHFVTSDISHPAKVYFGTTGNSINFSPGTRLIADKPVYAYYELNTEDETSAIAFRHGRPKVWPEPVLTTIVDEDIGAATPDEFPVLSSEQVAIDENQLIAVSNLSLSNASLQAGELYFQISTNAGLSYIFYSNSSWQLAGTSRDTYSSLSDINAGLPNLSLDGQTFSWRLLYNNIDGTNRMAIDGLSVEYNLRTPSTTLNDPEKNGFTLDDQLSWDGDSNANYDVILGTFNPTTGNPEAPDLIISNYIPGTNQLRGNNAISLSSYDNGFLKDIEDIEDSTNYFLIRLRDQLGFTYEGETNTRFVFTSANPQISNVTSPEEIYLESSELSNRQLLWSVEDDDVGDADTMIYNLAFTSNNGPVEASNTVTNFDLIGITAIDLLDYSDELAALEDNSFYYWNIFPTDEHGATGSYFLDLGNSVPFLYNVSNQTPGTPFAMTNTWADESSRIVNNDSEFYWQSQDEDPLDTLTYTLRFSTSPAGVYSLQVSTTNTNMSLREIYSDPAAQGGLVNGNSYYLRVLARDNRNASSGFTYFYGDQVGDVLVYSNANQLANSDATYDDISTPLNKNGLITWTSHPSYSNQINYRVEVATNSNFNEVFSTSSDILDTQIELVNLQNYENLQENTVYYYRLIARDADDNQSTPGTNIGRFRYIDEQGISAVSGSGVNLEELYIESSAESNFTIYYNVADADGDPVYIQLQFATNSEVTFFSNTTVTNVTNFKVTEMNGYDLIPDGTDIYWNIAWVSNSHGKGEDSFIINNNFYLNKTNNLPSGYDTISLSGNDNFLYLNDTISIPQASDPDRFDLQSNLFQISRSPLFNFGLYTVYTTNTSVQAADFENILGANFTNEANDQAFYIRVKAFDNREGEGATAFYTDGVQYRLKKDLRKQPPRILSPLTLADANDSSIFTWTNDFASDPDARYIIKVSNDNYVFFVSNIPSNSVDLGSLALNDLVHNDDYYFHLALYVPAEGSSLFSTNFGRFTFVDENAPFDTGPQALTGGDFTFDNQINLLSTDFNRIAFSWNPVTDADNDPVYYTIGILSNNSPDAYISNTFTSNIATNFLFAENLNNFDSLKDNSEYYIQIVDIRDSHQRYSILYDSASERKSFFLNTSNDIPNPPSTLELGTNGLVISNTDSLTIDNKTRFTFSGASDPDPADVDNLIYTIYAYETNTVTSNDLHTNLSAFTLTRMYERESTSTSFTLYDLSLSRYDEPNKPTFSNGSPFYLAISVRDGNPGGNSQSNYVFPKVIIYTNFNTGPQTTPSFIPNSQNVYSDNLPLMWSNVSDPDPNDSVFYQIRFYSNQSQSSASFIVDSISEDNGSVSSYAYSNITALSNYNYAWVSIAASDAYDGTNQLNDSGERYFVYIPESGEDINNTVFKAFPSTDTRLVSIESAIALEVPTNVFSENALVSVQSLNPNDTGLYDFETAINRLRVNNNLKNLNYPVFKLNSRSLLTSSNLDSDFNSALSFIPEDSTYLESAGLSTESLGLYQFNTNTSEFEYIQAPILSNDSAVFSLEHFSLYTLFARSAPSGLIDSLKAYPNPVVSEDGQELKLYFQASQAGDVDVEILSLVGEPVYTFDSLSVPFNANGETVEMNWDLKNNNGTRVAPGVYFIMLRFRTSSDGEEERIYTQRLQVGIL